MRIRAAAQHGENRTDGPQHHELCRRHDRGKANSRPAEEREQERADCFTLEGGEHEEGDRSRESGLDDELDPLLREPAGHRDEHQWHDQEQRREVRGHQGGEGQQRVGTDEQHEGGRSDQADGRRRGDARGDEAEQPESGGEQGAPALGSEHEQEDQQLGDEDDHGPEREDRWAPDEQVRARRNDGDEHEDLPARTAVQQREESARAGRGPPDRRRSSRGREVEGGEAERERHRGEADDDAQVHRSRGIPQALDEADHAEHSRVVVQLVALTNRVHTAETRPSEAIGEGGVARVLVCEDEPDILALIATRLEREGYDVITAADGDEGLRKALEHRPELLLLDWMMPGLSGLEVCTALRAHPEASRTRVLMLTARAQQSDIDAAFAAGVDDFIIKPFRSGELQQRVADLLART
nr:response regulator [Microcella frigidaquae]